MNEQQAEINRYNGTVALWYSCHHHVTNRDWRNIEPVVREIEDLGREAVYINADVSSVIRRWVCGMCWSASGTAGFVELIWLS